MHFNEMDNVVYTPSTNLVDLVIDEIALEGLDGITLEALWERLTSRLELTNGFPRTLQEQVWTICKSTKGLIFYQLPLPRPSLVSYNRYEFMDPDLGVISEPDFVPEDIYEYFPIDDPLNDIKGSCKDYYTRKKIDHVAFCSLEDVENAHGQKLVIVASQALREQALIGDTVCPNLEMSMVQYCFLERVGRSRYDGEVTQGKRSLAILKEDPKSLFYYRKLLMKHKLITKQVHYQKNAGHGTGGSLLHLPRFYVERKPKIIYLAERIIALLKTRENFIADYKEIKQELQLENSIKRLFKTSFFQKVVKTDLMVPYRLLYPQADSSEWCRKGGIDKEKKLRAVQLIDPNIDANDLWNKDDAFDDEEFYELDITNQLINVPVLKQANWIVEEAQDEGLSQLELAKKMGLPKLQARTILRNLSRANLIGTYMNDIGRQRITKYVAKKFEKQSKISKQYHKEVDKMKELTKNISIFESSFQGKVPPTKNFFYTENLEVRLNEVDKEQESDPFMNIGEQQVRGEQLFGVVNKILKKYSKLSRCKRRYEVSFNKVSEIRDLKDRLQASTHKIREQPPKKIIKLMNTDNVGDARNFCDAVLEETTPSCSTDGELKNLIKQGNTEDLKISGSVTYRILKRANMIIEAVKEHKVIDDMAKLIRLINEEEEREGYDVRIDKKSLVRLLQKLALDNLVKNIKLTLSAKGKKKCLTFICDPSINVNHSVIQSAVEQARVKFCLTRFYREPVKGSKQQENGENPDNNDKNKKIKSLQDFNIDANIIPKDLTFDPRAGKKYGYSPKFIRMQMLHQLMYYLVYEHPGPSQVCRATHIQNLKTLKGYKIDERMESEMGEIYEAQVGWKMFIPPLPDHTGWPKGWAMVCDILLRIPLSIFLKVFRIPFFIPDLDFYLSHPIRQHYLVKDLPILLRNALLLMRKYIFSIHDIIIRLCYIGLVQFGPQKLKEKDQVFIYLNRRSELLDTTSSKPGYHKTEDKEYPVTKYFFDKIGVVEKYWYDMWHICVNTPLGGRLAVQGTDIILEDLTKKTEMIQCLKPKTALETTALDRGIMPGDKKGAAGIDSAFFSHLKRNWNWDNFTNSLPADDSGKKEHETQRKRHLAKIHAKPIKFTECKGMKKITGPNTVNANALKGPKASAKPTNMAAIDKMLKNQLADKKSSTKQKRIVRHVLPKRRSRPRAKYDDIDYSALQRMQKLRVDWDPREDNILLVCKVVMLYMFPNPRSQIISCTAVRDILRSFSISSYNKTSRACQRRLLYMMKQPQTIHSVALGVEEIKQNYYVNMRYKGIVNKIKKNCGQNEQEEKISAAFKSLVAYVAKKYYDLSQSEASKVSGHGIKTLQEFNVVYEVNHPEKPKCGQGFTKDVTNVNEIHTATINSVIYSSMCCGKNRKNWAYQLFRIYQQYPEFLLRNAMTKIRSDGMISVTKHYSTAIKKYGNCLPISSSQYQLSVSYVYKFHTKLPLDSYAEIQEFVRKMASGYKSLDRNFAITGVEIQPPTGGMLVGLVDYIASGKLNFNIELPDHVITLDPKLQEYDETYIRIAKRYQDILTSLEMHDLEKAGYKESEDPLKDHADHDPSGARGEKMADDGKQNFVADESVEKNADAPVASGGGGGRVKKQPKKFRWGWYGDKNSNSNDGQNIIDEDWYFRESDDEEEAETVKFQDGSTIRIDRYDIQRARSIPVDRNIHEAFMKTHGDSFKNFVSTSCINKLIKIDQSVLTIDSIDTKLFDQPMDFGDENEYQHQENHENQAYEENLDRKPSVAEVFLKNVAENTECDAEYVINNPSREEDSTDVQRRYTRLALLKMREELSDDLPDSHHAHEYFVVNSFGILYTLPEVDYLVNNNPNLEIFDESLKNLSLLEPECLGKVANDLAKFATFPNHFPDYSRVKEDLEMLTELKEEEIDLMYDYVRNKHEQGASLKELTDKFYKILGDKMYDILDFVADQRLFLRSGVTEMHYIHYQYVDPWLIQSIRIMRLQREALPAFPPGSVYVFNSRRKNSAGRSSRVDGAAGVSGVAGQQTNSGSQQNGAENRKNGNGKANSSEKGEEDEKSENAEGGGDLSQLNVDKQDVGDADKSNLAKDANLAGVVKKTIKKRVKLNTKLRGNAGSMNSSCSGGNKISNKSSLRKNRTCLLQTKDIYTAAKRLDLNTAEDIRVVIRPWIQIDGVINKPMLEKMLGAVLAHCIMNPGINLYQIQTRFIPALQPYYTRELVELLVKLDCLQLKVLRKITPVLLSTSSSTKIYYPAKFDGSSEYENEMIIEATIGASIRFGTFTQRYQTRRYTSTTAV